MPRACLSVVHTGDRAPADGLERCARAVRAVVEAGQEVVEARAAAREAQAEYAEVAVPYWKASYRRAEALRRKWKAVRAAREAHETCQLALAEVYRAWRAAHPGAPRAEHERFFEEIGERAGLSGRQVMRLAGYRTPERSQEEMMEDYRLYQAGWTVREIARFRGLSVRAVHKGIIRCAAMQKASQFQL